MAPACPSAGVGDRSGTRCAPRLTRGHDIAVRRRDEAFSAAFPGVVLVDLGGPHIQPVRELGAAPVHSARSPGVRTTIVGGSVYGRAPGNC
ncbi:hypothetical protein J2X68_004963 [Streptomyces sp. 3330]|nr:hypothetical protein [Streptomyces sp. 3330]